ALVTHASAGKLKVYFQFSDPDNVSFVSKMTDALSASFTEFGLTVDTVTTPAEAHIRIEGRMENNQHSFTDKEGVTRAWGRRVDASVQLFVPGSDAGLQTRTFDESTPKDITYKGDPQAAINEQTRDAARHEQLHGG